MRRRIALVAGTVVTVCLGGSAAGAQLRPQSAATVPRAGARRQNPAQQTGVANRAQLERLAGQIRSRFGPVNGIFHAAGIAGDGLIHFKTTVAANRVLAGRRQAASSDNHAPR